jgi:hypothetical protein
VLFFFQEPTASGISGLLYNESNRELVQELEQFLEQVSSGDAGNNDRGGGGEVPSSSGGGQLLQRLLPRRTPNMYLCHSRRLQQQQEKEKEESSPVAVSEPGTGTGAEAGEATVMEQGEGQGRGQGQEQVGPTVPAETQDFSSWSEADKYLDFLEAMWVTQALKERHFDSWITDLKNKHIEQVCVCVRAL